MKNKYHQQRLMKVMHLSMLHDNYPPQHAYMIIQHIVYSAHSTPTMFYIIQFMIVYFLQVQQIMLLILMIVKVTLQMIVLVMKVWMKTLSHYTRLIGLIIQSNVYRNCHSMYINLSLYSVKSIQQKFSQKPPHLMKRTKLMSKYNQKCLQLFDFCYASFLCGSTHFQCLNLEFQS